MHLIIFLIIFNLFYPFSNISNQRSIAPNSNSYMTYDEFNNTFSSEIVKDYFNEKPITNTIKYFKHLNMFSPENSYGSCGYVSFIQYLSYLDTFYNDDIIPEKYEYNIGNLDTFEQARLISPGVIKQSYPYDPTNKIEYYNFIKENKDTDYQMYLMDIVNRYYTSNINEYECSIGMWDYQIIVDNIPVLCDSPYNYIAVQNFGTSAKPTDTNVISYFDNYVKEKLDANIPVMLHIANYDESTGDYNGYHSVVAYYYDSKGIHANFGWGSGSTDVVIGSDYQITEAGYIDISSLEIKHSDNYMVQNQWYCGCGNLHTHVYNYKYISTSNESHKSYCKCLDYIIEPHYFIFMPTKNYTICIHCNKRTTDSIVIKLNF
jgi:hypothetical protein